MLTISNPATIGNLATIKISSTDKSLIRYRTFRWSVDLVVLVVLQIFLIFGMVSAYLLIPLVKGNY